MRTIKFRAWDKSTETMGVVTTIDLGAKLVWLDNVRTIGFVWIALEQFTGLLDKNGKEIYEGDVVERGKEYDGVDVTASTGIVEYGDASFYVHAIKIGDITWEKGETTEYTASYDFYGPEGAEFSWRDLTVIGNIHENPELLK